MDGGAICRTILGTTFLSLLILFQSYEKLKLVIEARTNKKFATIDSSVIL